MQVLCVDFVEIMSVYMYTQYAKDILHHDKSFIWSKMAIICQGCSKEYIYSLPLYQGV